MFWIYIYYFRIHLFRHEIFYRFTYYFYIQSLVFTGYVLFRDMINSVKTIYYRIRVRNLSVKNNALYPNLRIKKCTILRFTLKFTTLLTINISQIVQEQKKTDTYDRTKIGTFLHNIFKIVQSSFTLASNVYKIYSTFPI